MPNVEQKIGIMKKLVLLSIVCLLAIKGYCQSPKGDRTLAWQIDLAENNNYDSAFAYGYNACMESVHLFTKWTDIESDTGVYNASHINGFLDVVNIYYPAWNVEVELQIAPTNTGLKEVPSELMNLPFNHPSVINRFKILLDTVFAHIPNVTLSALNIGNESDINFGTDVNQYNEFKAFLDSVSSHAKALYFNLHGTELNVGTTFTHHGLIDNATSNLCKSVNDSLDIVSVTYYPLNGDFTMKPPSFVSTDFGTLVSEYPDTTQPIYFVECGYASSPLCNSSETLQADFWTEVFDAWDNHEANIKHITVFKSTDWSSAIVNQLGQYYGIQDTIFKEYLRTLGVRTWQGDGTNKEAYERIKCELDARNWCNVSCSVTTTLTENANGISMSVYPNPAKDVIIFHFDQQLANSYTLKLFNSQGQLVRIVNNINDIFVLERQNLKSGIYLFQIGLKNDIFQRGKFIFE